MSYQNINIQSEDTIYRGIWRYYHKDWNIEAFYIPRKSIKEQEYRELNIQGHSIYFLCGEDTEGKTRIYIGRSSDTTKNISIFTRLSQHKNSTTEPYRDIWDSAIAISFKNLSFDEMRNLENYFYKALLPEVKLNGIEPDTNNYKYDDIKHKVEYIKEFVDYILKENVFKEQKKQEAKKAVSKLTYSEEELSNQGKRLVEKQFEVITEVQTPNDIIEKMLDLLPPEIWNPNTKFLDPACKSGEFLKAIFNRLMESPLYNKIDYPNELERALYILSEQLYGVALTSESYELARKNMYKMIHIVKIVNFDLILKCFNTISKETDNLQQETDKTELRRIAKTLETTRENLNRLGVYESNLADFIRNKFGEDKNMEFNVIIGNPPYQDESGKASLYDKFVNAAVELGDTVNMITRDNWLNGKAFEDMRNNLTENGLITDIVHYPKVGELFPQVKVAVAYFNWQKSEKGVTNYNSIKDGNIVMTQELDITSGVIYKSEIGKNIISKVGGRSNWAKLFNTRSYAFMDQRKRYEMDSVSTPDSQHTITVMINKDDPVYVSINNFTNVSEVYKYKVLCGVKINEASVENPGNALTNIKAIPKGVVASETWSLIATFDTEEETVNCKKYIQTRLVRFLANQTVNVKSTVTDNTFLFVPVQDFTNNLDIDWSQSITEIDRQLYQKYKLTKTEIQYIESTIKSMDDKPKYTAQDVMAAGVTKMLRNENQ